MGRRREPVTVEHAVGRQGGDRPLRHQRHPGGHDRVGQEPRHAAGADDAEQGVDVRPLLHGLIDSLVDEELPHHPDADRARLRRADAQVPGRPRRRHQLEPAVARPEQRALPDDEDRLRHLCRRDAQPIPRDRVQRGRDLERHDHVGQRRGPEHESRHGPGRPEIQHERVRLRLGEPLRGPDGAQVAVRRGRGRIGLAESPPARPGQEPVRPARNADVLVEPLLAELRHRRGRAERPERLGDPSVAPGREDRHALRRVGRDRRRVVDLRHERRDPRAAQEELPAEALHGVVHEERLGGPGLETLGERRPGGHLGASPRPLGWPERPQVGEVGPQVERQDEHQHDSRRQARATRQARDRRAEKQQEGNVRRQEVPAARHLPQEVERGAVERRVGGDERQQQEPEAPRAARRRPAAEGADRLHAGENDRRRVETQAQPERQEPDGRVGLPVVRPDDERHGVGEELPHPRPREIDVGFQEPPGGAEIPLPRVRVGEVEEPGRKVAHEEPGAEEPASAAQRQARIMDQQEQEDRAEHHQRLHARPAREPRDEPQAGEGPNAKGPGGRRQGQQGQQQEEHAERVGLEVRLRDRAVVRQQEGWDRGEEERHPGRWLIVEPPRQDVETEREQEGPGDRVQPYQEDGGPEQEQGRDHVEAVQRSHERLAVEERRQVLAAQDVLRHQGHRGVVAGDVLVEHRRDAHERRQPEERRDDGPARAARRRGRRPGV